MKEMAILVVLILSVTGLALGVNHTAKSHVDALQEQDDADIEWGENQGARMRPEEWPLFSSDECRMFRDLGNF